jgi:hypothetical protein
MSRALLQFEKEVTEKEQEFAEKVAELALEMQVEVVYFGGGVKNPKPQ